LTQEEVMSATLEVPEDVASQVRELVETGAYPDSGSAVRDAFRLLSEHRLRQQLKAKLANAFAQADRGEVVDLNEETKARIIREGHAKYERGDKLNPDVLP
jgi:Arc/MetJ-type ribon-helix-helix transcriptional regulator